MSKRLLSLLLILGFVWSAANTAAGPSPGPYRVINSRQAITIIYDEPSPEPAAGLPPNLLLAVPEAKRYEVLLKSGRFMTAGSGWRTIVESDRSLFRIGFTAARMAGLKIMLLKMDAAQYDGRPVTGLTDFRLRVNFINPEFSHKVSGPPALEPALERALANYPPPPEWGVGRPAPADMAAAQGLPSPAVKARTEAQGFHGLALAALKKEGLSEAKPENLKVFNQGQEAAVRVGSGCGQPGVVFFADRPPGRQRDENVYIVAASNQPGKRIEKRSYPPAEGPPVRVVRQKSHYERDEIYAPGEVGRFSGETEEWYWDKITLGDPFVSLLELPDPAQSGSPEPGRIEVKVTGPYSFAPRLELSLNKILLPVEKTRLGPESATQGALKLKAAFDASLLKSGPNEIEVALSGDPDKAGGSPSFFLDWVEVVFGRELVFRGKDLYFRFDPSEEDPGRPVTFEAANLGPGDRIEVYNVIDPLNLYQLDATVEPDRLRFTDRPEGKARYLVTTAGRCLKPAEVRAVSGLDLLAETNRADYLIISHRGFLEPLDRLVKLRRAQGLAVKVVDVEDVYNAFGRGLADPGAIRRFLHFASARWRRPAPAYVLLVGGGRSDLVGVKDFIPPLMTTLLRGRSPLDNGFVSFDGPEDPWPEMMIGRLPVYTAEECRIVVDKIIAFEASLGAGPESRRMLLVADRGLEDSCDRLAGEYLAEGWEVETIRVRDFPDEADPEREGRKHSPQCKARLLEAINQGRYLVHFEGHAGVGNWTNRHILTGREAARLSNQPPAIFFDMACLTGAFDRPGREDDRCLAEWLLINPGGGAVAAFVPPRAWGDERLAPAFLQALLKEGVATLGQAVLLGELLYDRLSGEAREPFGYLLLGDPALRLRP